MIDKIPNIKKYEKTAIIANFHDGAHQIKVSTAIVNYLKNSTKKDFPTKFMQVVTSNSYLFSNLVAISNNVENHVLDPVIKFLA